MPAPYRDTPAYNANLVRIYLNPHKHLPMNAEHYRAQIDNLTKIMSGAVDEDMRCEAARRIDFIEKEILPSLERSSHVKIVAQN